LNETDRTGPADPGAGPCNDSHWVFIIHLCLAPSAIEISRQLNV
jgi:hypothetical protein